MSNKAFYVYLFSSNNSSIKPTLPLMLPQIVCALLSPINTKKGGAVHFSMDVETQIKIKYDIKARFHEATFVLWRGSAIFKKMFQSFDQITTMNVLMDNFCSCVFYFMIFFLKYANILCILFWLMLYWKETFSLLYPICSYIPCASMYTTIHRNWRKKKKLLVNSYLLD